VLCALALGCGGAGPGAGDAAVAAAAGEGPVYAGIGRPATAAEVAAVDLDAHPDGHGLPPGRGSVAAGAALYAARCAMCHGARGEGMPPAYPTLVGREPRTGFPFADDVRHVKTIGNYWPQAVTLFDYLRRAMPYTAPGSLTADESYALTAYLLAANEVLPMTAVLDSASLRAVQMPARDRFVPDDRRGGREVR